MSIAVIALTSARRWGWCSVIIQTLVDTVLSKSDYPTQPHHRAFHGVFLVRSVLLLCVLLVRRRARGSDLRQAYEHPTA